MCSDTSGALTAATWGNSRASGPGLWRLQLAPHSCFNTSEVWPDPGVHLEASIQVPEAQNTPCLPPNEQEGLRHEHLPRSPTLN